MTKRIVVQVIATFISSMLAGCEPATLDSFDPEVDEESDELSGRPLTLRVGYAEVTINPYDNQSFQQSLASTLISVNFDRPVPQSKTATYVFDSLEVGSISYPVGLQLNCAPNNCPRNGFVSHTIENADIRQVLSERGEEIEALCRGLLEYHQVDSLFTTYDAYIKGKLYYRKRVSPTSTRWSPFVVGGNLDYQLGVNCTR